MADVYKRQTDCFPALALGVERPEADIMKRKPRKTSDGVFAGGMGIDMVYQGVILAGLTLIAYFVGHYIESGVWEIATSPDGTTTVSYTHLGRGRKIKLEKVWR